MEDTSEIIPQSSEITPQTSDLLEAGWESDDLKSETKALIDALKKRAQQRLNLRALTRETYISAASSAGNN